MQNDPTRASIEDAAHRFRRCADRAHEAGAKALATALHDEARAVEAAVALGETFGEDFMASYVAATAHARVQAIEAALWLDRGEASA